MKNEFNQQPKLRYDVEYCFERLQAYLYLGIKDTNNPHLPILKQHIKAQAKEIEELEEDNKELTNYYDKNKDYEQQYNVCINLMEEMRVNMWSEIHHRNIAEYKLNAIREVMECQYNYGTKEKVYNQIEQILEESK